MVSLRCVLRALENLAFAVFALAIFAAPGRGEPQNNGSLAVTDVRFWSLGEATRIAIETNGEFEYRYDRLRNPDRIYFDVLGASWPVSGVRIHTIPVGDKLLKQIRVAETRPDVTRVVLDLEVPVDFSSAQLANPNRLMIELRPAAPATQQPAPEEDRIPLPAKRNETGGRSLVRALGLKLGRVVLDPGHGGHDTGTIGPTGLMEKDLVLDVAKRLGTLIEERLGAEVIYTRTDDTFVPLEERTALANEKEADLFLSIHANAGVRSAAGAETYYLNFTTSRSALDVAARENASSEKTIHELQDLIQKIALKDKIDESKEFASKIQGELYATIKKTSRNAKDRGVRKAPFLVLIGASMPSALTEISFISNPREERLLKRADHRQSIAEGLYKGLSQYASTLSHFQVAERKLTQESNRHPTPAN
jgi:N-acetylmuramoyl-L-alanine amidase